MLTRHPRLARSLPRSARVLIACSLLAAALVGCAGPQATPDIAAIEGTAVAKVFATLTAAAPTPTVPPTAMPTQIEMPTPAATAAPEATPVPSTATAPPTAIPPADTPALVELTAAPTPAPSATETPAGPSATVRGASLNVRVGPGQEHARVAMVQQGATLAVAGRNGDGSWLEVKLSDDRTGWVLASLVQLNVPARDIVVAKVIPTAPPAPTTAPTALPKPLGAALSLAVSFINPHYNCENTTLDYEMSEGVTRPLWGYRSFQADLSIQNSGTDPVNPPWKPKRWIMTDGQEEFVNDIMWQWTKRGGGLYEQPVIQPGQLAAWTFVAFSLEQGQWVKAVEFVWNGEAYRQEFDLGPLHNAYNYVDCGVSAWAPIRNPTPTPRP